MIKYCSILLVIFSLVFALPTLSEAKPQPNPEIHHKQKKMPPPSPKEVKKQKKHKQEMHKQDVHKKNVKKAPPQVKNKPKPKANKKYKGYSHKRTKKGTLASLKRFKNEVLPTRRTHEDWVEHAKQGQLKSTGKASWYGKDFHGGPTASGVKYDMYTFTAAHRTLPMGTVVKVTRQDNDKSVMVCVTDRGPYVRGRIIDLSYAAATQLDLRTKGVGDVRLEVVSDAKGKPLHASQAFYVKYTAAKGKKMAGPYKEFADAAAMQEALRQAHPEATVVLDRVRRD